MSGSIHLASSVDTAAGTTTTTTTTSSFHRFASLPEEIRRLIWQFASYKFLLISPGVSHFYPTVGTSPIPAQWPKCSLTCREARQEAARCLVLLPNLTDDKKEPIPVRIPFRPFDPDIDILLVPVNFPGIFTLLSRLEGIEEVRRLAVSDNTLILERKGFKALAPKLHSLGQLMVLFQDELPREDIGIPPFFSFEHVDIWDSLTRIMGPLEMAGDYIEDYCSDVQVVPKRIMPLSVRWKRGFVQRDVDDIYAGEQPFRNPWASDYVWSDDDGDDANLTDDEHA